MSNSRSAQLMCHDLGFSYGARTLLDAVDLTVAPGDRVGVIGANGTGKSTLLRLLAGSLTPSTGSVVTTPPSATVGLMPQVLNDLPGDTVASHVARATGIADIVGEFDAAVAAMAQVDASPASAAADRYDHALQRWLAADAATFEERLAATLDRVGLPAIALDRSTAALSGGQRGRLALAIVLLAAFDIVLLDEPTNDLDLEGLALLEDHVLNDVRPTIVVSHDRAFLSAVATAIVEIDDHHHTITRTDGGYDAWLTERTLAEEHHRRAWHDYQDKRANLTEQIQRQQQWSARGVRRARNDRTEPDKNIRAYRIASSEKVASRARRSERALERLDRNESVEAPWKPWQLRLRFGEGGRTGDTVASLHGAVVERGDFRLGPLDLTVESGDRLLITGANGSGKSTLIDALLGRITLSSGYGRLAPSVRAGVLDQRRPMFSDAVDLTTAFAEAVGCDDQAARSQLAKLGLDTERLSRPVTSLSMGERTRATLGLLALLETNLLVVDEPTNHLDLPAIEALEVALEVYPHTLVVVSHDRRLIEAVDIDRRWHVSDGAVIER